MEEKHEPKIKLVEGIFMSLVIFVVSFFYELPILGGLVEICTVQGYLAYKGLGGTARIVTIGDNVIAEIISIIPGVGGLIDVLVDLAGFWIVIWIDHHPKLEKATQLAGKITGGVKGAAADAEGATEEAAGEASKAAEGAKGPAGGRGEAGAERTKGAERTGGQGSGQNTEEGEQGPGNAKKQGGPEPLGAEKPPMEELQKDIAGDQPVTGAPETQNDSLKGLKDTYKKAQDLREKYNKAKENLNDVVDKAGLKGQGDGQPPIEDDEDDVVSDLAA